MLAVSSSRREVTDGELGEGETGEGSGGQGDSGGEEGATAASKEGQEVAEEDETDGILVISHHFYLFFLKWPLP